MLVFAMIQAARVQSLNVLLLSDISIGEDPKKVGLPINLSSTGPSSMFHALPVRIFSSPNNFIERNGELGMSLEMTMGHYSSVSTTITSCLTVHRD